MLGTLHVLSQLSSHPLRQFYLLSTTYRGEISGRHRVAKNQAEGHS